MFSCYLAVTGFGNTTKRLTHGTTTLSQEQEDYDHIGSGADRRSIKPKSLYPSRDAENAPAPRRGGDKDDDDRSQSRTRCKSFDLHKSRSIFDTNLNFELILIRDRVTIRP